MSTPPKDPPPPSKPAPGDSPAPAAGQWRDATRPPTSLYATPDGKVMVHAGRNQVLYITIDQTDLSATPAHAPNIDRLREILAKSPIPLGVSPMYYANVTAAKLADPHVFMLFLAGSWPEWCELWSDSAWEQGLKAFGEVIKSATVPTYAVCGSHQFLAASYTGWTWTSVAHMNRAAEPLIAPSDEKARKSLHLPGPSHDGITERIGEVGAFPFTPTSSGASDPLLAGLSGTSWFIEHHHDKVLESRRSSDFVSLLAPATDEPFQDARAKDGDGKVRDHRPVLVRDDRCDVQLLKLKSDSRILYTSQFHPELSCGQVSGEVPTSGAEGTTDYWKANNHATTLLLNFVKIAQSFWRRS
jgi:GMP synthase-like glutamine amidotransferase